MSQNASKATLRTQAPFKMSPKVTRKTKSKVNNDQITLEYGQERVQRRLPYVDYVMNTRQAQGNEVRKIEDKCKTMKVRCAMPVNMNVRNCDFE